MTTENKNYNGWKNYETWNVKLWLDNDQDTQERQRELAQQAKETPKVDVWTREETTRFTLADLLKEWIENENPLADDASMWADLMGAALSNVDWQEIADSILENT